MYSLVEIYGYHHLSITSPLKHTAKIQTSKEHIGKQQNVVKLLMENLVIAKNRMIHQESKQTSEKEFGVIDWVFLRL